MRFLTPFIQVFEGVTIALDALKANRARALLTIMGVALGVFVVVAMSSVVRGINESFRRDLEAAATRVTVPSRPAPSGATPPSRSTRSPPSSGCRRSAP